MASAPGLVAMYISVSFATFSIVVRPSFHAASVAPAGLLAAVKKVGTNSCNCLAAFSPAASWFGLVFQSLIIDIVLALILDLLLGCGLRLGKLSSSRENHGTHYGYGRDSVIDPIRNMQRLPPA